VSLLDLPTAAAIVLATRLCLGFILLFSAFGKLTNRSKFLQGIADYQILPDRVGRAFGHILPWLELGLAFMLILGIALPLVGSITVLLIFSFTVGVAINLRRGRQLDCHCYGIASPHIISRGTIIRNILLLLLAAILIVFALNINELNGWRALWQIDRQIILSGTIIPLALLLAFYFVAIHLVEWVVGISDRISRLKTSDKPRGKMA
jgi:hypothetical protein